MAWDITKVTLGNPTRKSDHDQLIDNLVDLAGSGRTTENVKDNADAITQPGVILSYGGTSAPAGHLLCDGSAINRVTYSNLFDIIGESFGEGDGSITFNIPDLRGYFLRGRDAGQGIDPNAATRTALQTGGNTGDNVGSKQADAFQSHRHTHSIPNYIDVNASISDYAHTGNSYWGQRLLTIYGPSEDGVYGIPRAGYETRPINVYVNYIIKY